MSAPTFHLDKANGKMLGVCAGIADHFDVDATIVRFAAVLLTLITGPVLLLAYLLLALFAADRPR